MSKYQTALDKLTQASKLHNVILTDPPIDETQEAINILQELVDNYSNIQQFDKAIFFNADGVAVNGISYEQLEKALDKACECLEDGYGNEYADYKYYKDLDTSIKIPESMDYKEWKEWCLKDE